MNGTGRERGGGLGSERLTHGAGRGESEISYETCMGRHQSRYTCIIMVREVHTKQDRLDQASVSGAMHTRDGWLIRVPSAGTIATVFGVVLRSTRG